VGVGRLASVERVLAAIERALGRGGPLWRKRVVVTAGATREAIDPIRILTNRSTGRMGYAIARAALQAGADVTLISTPTTLPPVHGVTTVPVESALDLLAAVREHAAGADVLVMAAAVADYRPTQVAADKIKKSDDDMAIQLTRNPDILSTIATPGTVRVGFAAETSEHERHARGKLERKNLDLIVLNDARAAMGAETNAVTLFFRDGRVEALGEAGKLEIAEQIVQRIAGLLPAEAR
ncbi:MAG TPA: bifunctional phosphopantothenoylcysteine decarboxylase/phosphopantothenate--cysteine ligase CoaBC, partial [Thermomicrobiales bacterium]|nr:bifunctional phosphopantothenoylcysteine decarboxylase/phosphopantothenate--cysteine ligase CoaBC [Thermomicrobiales bacterium]